MGLFVSEFKQTEICPLDQCAPDAIKLTIKHLKINITFVIYEATYQSNLIW